MSGPGPLRDVEDPAFLAWPNLRVVVSIGLGVGLLSGAWDAVWHGWSGVDVAAMVVPAVWIPVALVVVHLWARRSPDSHDRGP